MTNPDFIQFRRKRDFSAKLNATFAFARLNFKPFMLSIVYIAGPPVLIASLMLSSFVGDFFKMTLGGMQNPDLMESYFLSANFWLQLGVMFIFMVVSYIAVLSVTNNYLVLYDEKKGEPIDVNEVWNRVRETFGMYAGTSILFALLSVAAYALMVIPVIVLGAISPFLVFFGAIFFICLFMYLLISASLIFVVRAFEKTGFMEGLIRSYRLVRGKWWSTFGLLFILSFIVGVISYIFSIPAAILQGITMVHDVSNESQNEPAGIMSSIIFVLNSLAYLSQLLLYFLPNIGLAFQYFNLVELKESKGLLSDLDKLGQASPRSAGDDQY